MGRIVVIAVCVVLFGLSADSTKADRNSCRNAARQFKSARVDLSSAISSYASCVSGSDGHDDCSSDASSVLSEQSEFESAVSEYESECN
jgi:hypothetical protein